jgi:integrase
VPSKRRPRDTGAIRKLPSGRYQARFRGTDGVMRPAGVTFDTREDAAAWLAAELRATELGIWSPPEEKVRVGLFRDYAAQWLAARDLKPSTRALYADLLEDVVLPGLGHYPLDRITVGTVARWYDGLDPSTPTKRAHAYSLARSIFRTAASRELIPANPCRVEGGGVKRKQHVTQIISPVQLHQLADEMPEKLRALVLLAGWCGLRQGELFELRRRDLDLEAAVVTIERGVTRVKGVHVVGEPKSAAGRRAIAIPPHILPVLEQHLAQHVAEDRDALLFPNRGGSHMQPSTFYQPFYDARKAVGLPTLRLHDLRHVALTMAAQAGATTKELMQRAGHTTATMALHYQGVAAGRDAQLAAALSALVATPEASEPDSPT